MRRVMTEVATARPLAPGVIMLNRPVGSAGTRGIAFPSCERSAAGLEPIRPPTQRTVNETRVRKLKKIVRTAAKALMFKLVSMWLVEI